MPIATVKFQEDALKLLSVIKDTSYSKKEVFLHELVSNASDSLDKIRFQSLTNKEVLASDAKMQIQIIPDKAAKTLTLIDSGIGMTKTDLVKNLGSITRPGTKALLEAKQGGDVNENMIDQFGLGFFSAYLVADRVTVMSKHNDDEAFVWESSDNDYTVTPIDAAQAPARGTKIVLHLKEDQQEYLEERRVKDLINKHSAFIGYDISLLVEKSEVADDEAEEEKPNAEDDDEPTAAEVDAQKEKKTKKVKVVSNDFEILNENRDAELDARLALHAQHNQPSPGELTLQAESGRCVGEGVLAAALDFLQPNAHTFTPTQTTVITTRGVPGQWNIADVVKPIVGILYHTGHYVAWWLEKDSETKKCVLHFSDSLRSHYADVRDEHLQKLRNRLELALGAEVTGPIEEAIEQQPFGSNECGLRAVTVLAARQGGVGLFRRNLSRAATAGSNWEEARQALNPMLALPADSPDVSVDPSTEPSEPDPRPPADPVARGRSLSLSKKRHSGTSDNKFGSRPTSCAGDRVVYRVLNDKEFALSETAMVRSNEEVMSAPCAPCVSDLHIKRYAAGDRREFAHPATPGVTGCIEKRPGAHITAGTKAKQKSFWVSTTRSLRVAAGWAHNSLTKSTGPVLATAIIARIQLPDELPTTEHQIDEKTFPHVLDYSAFCKTTRDEVVKSNDMDSLNGTCPVKHLADGLGLSAFNAMKSSQEVLIHGEIPTTWVTGLYRVELLASGAHSTQESVSSPSHAEGSDSSAQRQSPLPTKDHPVRLEVYTSSAVDKATLPIVVLSDAWGLGDPNASRSSSSSSSPRASSVRCPSSRSSSSRSSGPAPSASHSTLSDATPVTYPSPAVVTAGTTVTFNCEHCGRHDFATKKSCTSHKGHCKENPKRRA